MALRPQCPRVAGLNRCPRSAWSTTKALEATFAGVAVALMAVPGRTRAANLEWRLNAFATGRLEFLGGQDARCLRSRASRRFVDMADD